MTLAKFAIIAALALNFGGAVWWAADITTRLGTVERDHAATAGLAGDVRDVKARLGHIEDSLKRLEDYFFRRAAKRDRESFRR